MTTRPASPVLPEGEVPEARTPARVRRCRGDRGAGAATALVLLFTMTAGGIIWLARDVDRAISHRGAAQSIAFQAARSGAQQIDTTHLRATGSIRLDESAARSASLATADALLGSYGLSGSVAEIAVDGDRITVTVTVADAGRTVTGVGAARAATGPP